MIKYRLKCNKGHEFEAWFTNSAAFDTQAKRGQVSCPSCRSSKVTKALMAPQVATRGRSPAPQGGGEGADDLSSSRDVMKVMREVFEKVTANAEYVGPRFAEEARKIHYEEAEGRGIYGEASLDDARALHEEGIDILPLPRLPKDHN